MKAPDKIYLYPYLDSYDWTIKDCANSIEYRRVDEEDQSSSIADMLDEFAHKFHHGELDIDEVKSKYTIIRNK